MMSAMTLQNSRRSDEGARPKWRPISFWPWTLAAAFAVVIVAVGVTMWLLAIAGGAKPGTDRANSRLDAVRTGLAAGAGAGAAVGLMLAFRRQHHQEIATDLSDRDATERRITELYTKAVEQLGNDKAPVRLGGLYALERLAQDNPAHRQTIVNVICAYLRMPFSPTASAGKPEPKATEDPAEPATEAEPRADASGDIWQQERQVRLTAQRILAEHLRDDRAEDKRSTDPPSPRFWPDIRLDLAGATLINFDLEDCVMVDVNFEGATFSGVAAFEEATIRGTAWFLGATFTGGAGFVAVTFRDAFFDDATFWGVSFIAAKFRRVASFNHATFSGSAKFGGAIFLPGNMHFARSRVLSPSPDPPHDWPTGWGLEPDGSGGYTVARASNDASQLIPGDGSDGSGHKGSGAVLCCDRPAGQRLPHLTGGQVIRSSVLPRRGSRPSVSSLMFVLLVHLSVWMRKPKSSPPTAGRPFTICASATRCWRSTMRRACRSGSPRLRSASSRPSAAR
jgi:Pentapeptide repeats (9 copies)